MRGLPSCGDGQTSPARRSLAKAAARSLSGRISASIAPRGLGVSISYLNVERSSLSPRPHLVQGPVPVHADHLLAQVRLDRILVDQGLQYVVLDGVEGEQATSRVSFPEVLMQETIVQLAENETLPGDPVPVTLSPALSVSVLSIIDGQHEHNRLVLVNGVEDSIRPCSVSPS